MKTFCTLSKANLLHNLEVIKSKAPRSKIMAMIKDNAYGHGMMDVAKILEHEVDELGVASLEDALVIKKRVTTPITLIEGVSTPGELKIACKNHFSIVFHSDYQIDWLKNFETSHKIKAWLKLDTGMGRLGFFPKQAAKSMRILSESPSIDLEQIGIMSHFSCADNPNHPLNKKQIKKFQEFVKNYKCLKSFCNSAAILGFPEVHYDMVRPGLALYGGSPIIGKTAEELDLRPVMTFKTDFISIRKYKRNDTVSYGGYKCPNDMTIGIAAVGYGHGYPRAIKKGEQALVNGVRCDVVGRVMMDMTAIDLSSCKAPKLTDIVTLWGEGLPIEEVAKISNRISYDLLTGVRNRVKYEWE